jgi:hypothetical protein
MRAKVINQHSLIAFLVAPLLATLANWAVAQAPALPGVPIAAAGVSVQAARFTSRTAAITATIGARFRQR